MKLREKIEFLSALMSDQKFSEGRDFAIKDIFLKHESREILPYKVLIVRAIILGAGWEYVNKLLPPNTNFFTSSGWLRTLWSGTPVSPSGETVPWFTYPALRALEGFVHKDMRVCEWGAGNSTLWWSRKVSEVFSAEDNPAWYNKIVAELPGNVQITLAHEENDYVNCFLQKGPYDIAVVDGSHRVECLKSSPDIIKETGIIILDNSDRAEYGAGVHYLKESGFKRVDYFGLISAYPYEGCTSIFFKGEDFIRPRLSPDAFPSDLGPTCAQALGE